MSIRRASSTGLGCIRLNDARQRGTILCTQVRRATYQILVIEDSAADALIIREAFAECGYRCELTVVASHAEAQAIIAGRCFDLLLCDYGGERTGGSPVIREMRERAPLTPIVVLSGYGDVRPAYRAGANAFVSKPGSLDEFFQKVRGIMQFWIDVAQLPPTPQ